MKPNLLNLNKKFQGWRGFRLKLDENQSKEAGSNLL